MGVEESCFIFIFDEKGLFKERLGSFLPVLEEGGRLPELFPHVWKELEPFLEQKKGGIPITLLLLHLKLRNLSLKQK